LRRFICILTILTYFINRTKYGKAMQAVAEGPTTASLLGINIDRFIVPHILHQRFANMGLW